MKINKIALWVAMCCMALVCRTSRADTLTFKSVSGDSFNGYYTYQYQFSLNGAAQLINLMCMDASREVTLGESWVVSIMSMPTDSSTLSTQYRENAWILAQVGKKAPDGSTYTNQDVQTAAWQVFSPGNAIGMTANAQSLLNQAATQAASASLISSGFFGQFDLFLPTSNQTGWTSGPPQRFVGYASSVTPEPSSLLLLGTGLALVAFVGVKRRSAISE